MQKLNNPFGIWGGDSFFFFCMYRPYNNFYVKCSKIKINSVIQTGSRCNGNQMGVIGPRWLEWVQKNIQMAMYGTNWSLEMIITGTFQKKECL